MIYDVLSTETLDLLRKVAVLRLLSGNTTDLDQSVREWAQAELDRSEWVLVRRDHVVRKFVSTTDSDDLKSELDQVVAEYERAATADAVRHAEQSVAKPDEVTSPTAQQAADVVQADLVATTPVKRTRRTKAEMDVVRQTVQRAYGDKVLSAPRTDGWETAHNEALVYVDALGQEAPINLSPSQVREAVAKVVDTYRREFEQPGTTAAAAPVPASASAGLSPQASQTQRNVELINQGINPRTGQPLTVPTPDSPVSSAETSELTDDLFAQFMANP